MTENTQESARAAWNALYSRAKEVKDAGDDPRDVLDDAGPTLAALAADDVQAACRKIQRLTGDADFAASLEKEIKERRRRMAGEQEPTLPVVIVNGRQAGEVTREASAALLNHVHVYRHGTRLAQLVQGTDRPELRTVESKHTEHLLGRHVFTCEVRDRIRRATPPPPWLYRTVLQELENTAPRLDGLIEIPPVHPDGSIHTAPGYDPVSRLLYVPGELQLSIPDAPTQEDAIRAAQALQDLWSSYPFASPESAANHRALLLTAVLRSNFRAVPMCLSDGNHFGVGKTSLGLQAGILQTGRYPAVTTKPESSEEFRKKVTTEIEAGAPLIILDNVTGFLQDSALAAVLTTSMWGDRRLGTNQKIELPCKAVWLATGRNLAPKGDMVRRVFWIYLETEDTQPEKRKFDRDMNAYVMTHRGEILSLLYTMIRAWYLAGQPDAGVRMGSFDEWARVIGGILAYAGVTGFLENSTELEDEADTEAQEAETFARAILDHYGRDDDDKSHGKAFTAAQLARDITAWDAENSDRATKLRDALPSRVADAKPGELGKRLGDYFYFWRRAPLGDREHGKVRFTLLPKKARMNKRLWRVDWLDWLGQNAKSIGGTFTAENGTSAKWEVQPIQSNQSNHAAASNGHAAAAVSENGRANVCVDCGERPAARLTRRGALCEECIAFYEGLFPGESV